MLIYRSFTHLRTLQLMTTLWIKLLLIVAMTGGILSSQVVAQKRPPTRPATQAPAQAALTNQDIIRLVKAKLSDELIITKIRQSKTQFDLSTDGLIQLKEAGVSDKLLAIMMNPSTESNAPPPPKAPASDAGSKVIAPASQAPLREAPAPVAPPVKEKAPPLPPDKGVYLWDGKSLHLLYRNDAASTGQNVWRIILPGVKKKLELQLIGAYAKVQFAHSQPTILVSGLGDIIPGVPSFRLLYVKTGGMLKDRRIVGTYDIGGFFGSVSRVDNEIECQMKTMAQGVYAFTPLKPLSDGEYGLVQSAQAAANPLVWDFGVYAEGRPPEKKK